MDQGELEQLFKTTWAVTIKRSESSLDLDDRETIDTFRTWEDLTQWLISAPSPLVQIRLALNHLKVFAMFFEVQVNPDPDASYLWGSLTCLLQLVSSNLKTLEHVPRMVKSLSLKAEVFNNYCTTKNAIGNAINEVCLDMQVQFVEFFTISIQCIRAIESGAQEYSAISEGTSPQQQIQKHYELATLVIGESLSRLERLRATGLPSEEDPSKAEIGAKQHCLMLPPTKTTRLFNRHDIFIKLDELLTADTGDFSLQSVALHGIGGVGKSSIASSYANKKFSEKAYDVVLWVAAEKDASLQQSYSDIATRLKLPGAKPLSNEENLFLVHNWLQTTECKWLIIYDNVESSDILAPYWPRASRHGRAIITTRNHSLAFDPAASGLEVTAWNTEDGAEFLFFMLKRSIGHHMISENTAARTLSQRLSGHALALSNMAALIHDNEYTIQGFTTMYLESSSSNYGMDELAMLWDISFQSLDVNSFSLLGIISFLMPDNIPPEIFEPREDYKLPHDLRFLEERLIGFSAALRKLTTRALIKRDKDSGVLTVHRLIQSQFRHFLDPEKFQKAFNDTVTLMTFVIPKSDPEKGQLYETWEGYNRYLQHLINLRDIFKERMKTPHPLKASWEFCEMLANYQRYFYEKNDFEECERTCSVNRVAISTIALDEARVDLEGRIISYQAQIVEELGDPLKAIEICQQEIDLRLSESPRKDILLSFSTCNLGMFYCSANNFTKALKCFQESRQWWIAHFNKKDKNKKYASSMLVHEARCYLSLGEFEKAKEMLDLVITQTKEEKPLNFWVMAYAHFCIGTLERHRRRFDSAEAQYMEAQNTWLGHDQTRFHPFNASILYKIGACCLDQGKVEASIKHIKDSIEVTEIWHRIMPVIHARNLFKLSEALFQNGDDHALEARELREKADFFLKKKLDTDESSTENAYDNLIPICGR
ncbi:pfs domain-containing protein [Annulohypoxylon nitens]|nr:pfs domain-containing protein [Annulohypoxylon nitens]